MSSGCSLVDLKAELSRKESELNEKKTARSGANPSKTFAKIQEATGKRKHKKNKHKRTNTRIPEVPEPNNEVADETLQLLEKARQKLEAKAKIYEKMQSGEMEDLENIYGETKFLVDFQRKHYTYGSDDDDANCEGNEHTTPPGSSSTSSSLSLFEAGEEHREKMRAKWEQEQEELLNGPVHYENVKFDEVRNLGTGYFAFSKNEEERKKQLEEFQNMRQETVTIQTKKDGLQRKRKAALQDRLDKVKQRKLGNNLTGAEDPGKSSLVNETNAESVVNINETKDTAGEITESVDETSENIWAKGNVLESSDSVGTAASAEIHFLPQQDDNLLQHCRKASQKEREWDKGKNDMQQEFVKPNKYSYEKHILERRNEREETFAPPNSY